MFTRILVPLDRSEYAARAVKPALSLAEKYGARITLLMVMFRAPLPDPESSEGAFQTRDYEEIMNKASCLSLLCNAVLVWNTVHMSRIIEQLRATGVTVTDEDVALISPLAYAHVIPNGTYFFDRVREADTLTPGRTC